MIKVGSGVDVGLDDDRGFFGDLDLGVHFVDEAIVGCFRLLATDLHEQLAHRPVADLPIVEVFYQAVFGLLTNDTELKLSAL